MIDKQVDFWEVSTRISDFEQFLRFERQLAEGTIFNYIRAIKEFRGFVNKDLMETSKEDIRAFIMILNQRGLTHAGIGNYITGLRSYFIWFAYITKDSKITEVNFFLSKIIRIKREQTIPVVMPTMEEIIKLRKTIGAYKKAISFNPKSDTYKTILREIAVIELLITTGIRNKELRSLKFMDVDLTENIIFVKQGKGNLQRFSVFNDTAHIALKEYFTNNNFSESDLIFPYKQGNILNYIIKRWAKKAGVNQKLHAHSFRHFYITETLSRGARIEIVGDQVGHRNLNSTKRYTHFNIGILKKHLNKKGNI